MAKPPPLPTQPRKTGFISGCVASFVIGLIVLFVAKVVTAYVSASRWDEKQPEVIRSLEQAINAGNYQQAFSIAQPYRSRGDAEINALISKAEDLQREAAERLRQGKVDILVADLKTARGANREEKLGRLLELAPDLPEFVEEFAALREKARMQYEEANAREEAERKATAERAERAKQEQFRASMDAALAEFKWKYRVFDDALTSKPVRQATVTSINQINFSFPYHGEQRGELTLRTHPQHGKDLIFRIQHGQILVNSFQDSTVKAVFDDSSPITYQVAGPTDHSTTTLFIRDYHGFVERMLKAKKLKMAVPFFQQGAVVFEFNVMGFDADRYLGKKE
jgi:hypothetical protein